MKKLYITFMLCTVLIANTRAQCFTLVEMVNGLSCLLPQVVSTQTLLLPCSYPPGFNQLIAGDFALIDYTPSSCVSVCMQGTPVDITCFSPYYVGMDEALNKNGYKLYPNPAIDKLTIEMPQKATIEIINLQGQIIKTLTTTEDKTQVDVSALPGGVYFIKLNTEEGSVVRKFVKE